MAKPGSNKTSQPKTVEILVSKDGTCSPEHAKARSIDRVMWKGNNITHLHFPDDNPFDNEKAKKFPPHVAHQVAKSSGKYTYNVVTPTASYDPDVEIEPPPH
jgi:hypothetical protein